jgi:hypothetical protein
MRKPLLAGLAVLLVLVGILVPLVMPRPSRVTRANYERIEMGMTQAQVEEILGGPPGDYSTVPTDYHAGGPMDIVVDMEELKAAPKSGLHQDGSWFGDEGNVSVGYLDGKALCKTFTPTEPVAVETLELLRWRLERRWERLWGR